MILHYLWIDKFIIEEEGFNFSPVFDFRVEKIDDQFNVYVTRKTQILPQGFFSLDQSGVKEKVLNLSCIVGENGTGKSTILRCLRGIHEYPRETEEHAIWIFGRSDGNFEPLQVFGSVHANVSLIFDEIENEQSLIHFREKASIIYYSTSFDHLSHIPPNPTFDISTNELLRRSPEHFFPDDPSQILETSAFKVLDFDRSLQFLFAHQELIFDYLKPESERKCIIHRKSESIEHVWRQLNVDPRLPEEIQSNTQQTGDFNKFKLSNEQASEIYKIEFIDFIIITAFYSLVDRFKLVEAEADWIKSLESMSRADCVANIEQYLENQKNSENNELRRIANSTQIFIKTLKEVFNSHKIGFWENVASIPFSVNMDSPISKIFKAYKEMYPIREFLEFDLGLSSGEQNRLTLFSRFHSLVGNSDKPLKSNILILFDEPTESYHPKWQRRFIKDMLESIPRILGSDKTIQIIMATHSPLTLSDIPRDNVIVLKSKDDKVYPALEETFGANIHQLILNAMFLDKTIGEFAAEKIKKVIHYLKAKSSEKKENEETVDATMNPELAQAYINLIGEPILKKHLQLMFDDIIGMTNEEIDAAIEKLNQKRPKS